MKSLSCKDLGTPECDFVAKGETAEGVVQEMADHAMQAHADKIAEMSKTMTPDQMKEMMMSKVKDEA